MSKKPDTDIAIASIEIELAGLQKRRSSLAARHDAAASALDKAKADRRAMLTAEDDPPAAKLAAADKAVREADDARVAAADAGQEIATMIEAVSTRLAALIEAEQREQRAAYLETIATAAEAAIARLHKAAAEIGSARQALAKAIGVDAVMFYEPPVVDPEQSYVTYLGKSWFDFSGNDTREMADALSGDMVASRIAGHLLAPMLPTCAVTSAEEIATSRKPMGPTQALCPIGDPAGARRLIVDPMRTAAAEMRAAPLAAAA